MSLKYLVRRRAAKINHRRDIRVDHISEILGVGHHFMISARNRGISQVTVSDAMHRALKYHLHSTDLDSQLRI